MMLTSAQRPGLGLVKPICLRSPANSHRQPVKTVIARAQKEEEPRDNLGPPAKNVRDFFKRDEPAETSDQQASDSYAQIEAPVRSGIPDRGPPVSERDWGQALNPDFKTDTWNPDKRLLGTKVGLVDSFRFAGATPEVANSRLAMLGFALAVIGEATTGRNVFEQVGHAPAAVASIFVLFTVATVVPVLRGVPRRGNEIFTADAELINGRVAMLGFFGLVLLSFYQGSYLGAIASWFT